MAALGEVMDVIDTNSGEAGHFRIGEDFLARFDGYHVLLLDRALCLKQLLCLTQQFDAGCRLSAALSPCNSRSVLCGEKP